MFSPLSSQTHDVCMKSSRARSWVSCGEFVHVHTPCLGGYKPRTAGVHVFPSLLTDPQCMHGFKAHAQLGELLYICACAYTMPRGLTRPVGVHVFPSFLTDPRCLHEVKPCTQLGEFWTRMVRGTVYPPVRTSRGHNLH